jgi:hypothetical protein
VSLSVFFYVQNVDRRESWVVYLLSECFHVRGVVSLASAHARNPSQADALPKKVGANKNKKGPRRPHHLPPLGAAFHPAGVRGRLHSAMRLIASDRSRKVIDAYVYRLNLALNIFEGLARLRDAGVVAIFNRFLLEKFRPDSYDTSRRNKLCLPPALAMFK